MKLERTIVVGRPSSGVKRARAKAPAWLREPVDVLPRIFKNEFWAVTALVTLSSFAVIAPMVVLSTVSGHDFPFHLTSWMDVASQWQQGTYYPQWAKFANWGFGEPRFVFYPPGSWMLGAALGSVFPWKLVPMIFVWLVLGGAGMSMFVLAREAMRWQEAALAAAVFAANPYNLLLVYYRSDFAELLAGAFFPLLVWSVLRTLRGGWRPVSILALIVALIWLSNAPAAVIAMYSVAFLLVIGFAVIRDRRVLLHGALAIVGGLGLAAFYILPAAHQRAWVQINQVLADGLRPEQNFLFSRAASVAVNLEFNLKISCVVLLMGLVIWVTGTYVWKSGTISRAPFALMAALAAMSLFMMVTLSRPVWALAPELHFVQFPWRYALPLGVSFAFFLAPSVGKSKRLTILTLSVFVLAAPLAKIVLARVKPSSWSSADIEQYQRNFDSGIGYRGTLEYLPKGANNQIASEHGRTPRGALAGSEVSANVNGSGSRNGMRVQLTASKDIRFNLFDYPTWRVEMDRTRVSKLADRDGRVAISLPAGDHTVRIAQQTPWDAKLGIAISILTAIVLAAMTVVPRKQIETWRHINRPPSEPSQMMQTPAPSLSIKQSEQERFQ